MTDAASLQRGDGVRPTLSAVAARAGVSVSTASLAFSGAGPVSAATRERVLAAAEELGYAGPDPRAASLRRGRSGIIGVVLDDTLSDVFRDPVSRAMVDGIAEELPGTGLLLLTRDADLRAAPVDAVIFMGCAPRVADSSRLIRQRSIPIVAIEADAMEGVAAIDLDNRRASRALAQHLADLGHRQVALVTLPLDEHREAGPLAHRSATIHTTAERIRGTREVFPSAEGWASAASLIDEGVDAGRALLRAEPRPTAIVAQSDLLAIGVIRAASELGIRVPGELSVVGFDGVPLDGLAEYDLTTMVQPTIAKGRAAARAVLDLLEGAPVTSVAFESEFHRGATTAPVPR